MVFQRERAEIWEVVNWLQRGGGVVRGGWWGWWAEFRLGGGMDETYEDEPVGKDLAGGR